MDAKADGLEHQVEERNVSCCPKFYPCPHCGKRGKRKQRLQRQVRSLAYGKIVDRNIDYAKYRARCDCCKTFRSSPPGVGLRWQYDEKVHQAVIDRLIEEGMSVQRLLAAMRRDFLLDLSEGFVYDCLHRERSPGWTWASPARGPWNNSAARCASTSCTWDATRCCWRPIL